MVFVDLVDLLVDADDLLLLRLWSQVAGGEDALLRHLEALYLCLVGHVAKRFIVLVLANGLPPRLPNGSFGYLFGWKLLLQQSLVNLKVQKT